MFVVIPLPSTVIRTCCFAAPGHSVEFCPRNRWVHERFKTLPRNVCTALTRQQLCGGIYLCACLPRYLVTSYSPCVHLHILKASKNCEQAAPFYGKEVDATAREAIDLVHLAHATKFVALFVAVVAMEKDTMTIGGQHQERVGRVSLQS